MSIQLARDYPARQAKVDNGLTTCYPERQLLSCVLCMRLRRGAVPENRQFVVIDASLFVKDGACPMFEGRPTVRPYAEQPEPVQFDATQIGAGA